MIKRKKFRREVKLTDDTKRRISPALVVMVVAGSVLLIAAAGRYFASRHTASVDAKVTMEPVDEQVVSSDGRRKAAAGLPDGEVYRTAERLCEAAALAHAATLYAINQSGAGHPPKTVDKLLSALSSADLYPPGVVRTDATGVLSSDRATLHVRYRARPFRLEVISFGRSREDGPALMVRVPGDGIAGDRGVLFIASRLGEIDAPPPFAPARDCLEAGWVNEPLRGLEIAEGEREQLSAWLASQPSLSK
ncbi:MAG TPA: hypothetical protein VNO14_18595 [Blastocatellia bacterium]|nr:hypothetical protein [Blastocatellia bacterium]